jgi:hypothetical protein
MTRRRFSQTEVEYLRSLPAVEAVTENRITYSHDFQVSCMSRYLQGERPSVIFTSAGLSPMIVGHKHVERNIARWKHDDEIMNEAKQPGAMAVMPTDARNRLITMQMADPVADPPGDRVEAACRGA